jgi:hypothetical protein
MKTATRYLTAARRHAVVRILGLLVLLVALPAAPGTSNGAAPRGLVAAPASPAQGEQVFYGGLEHHRQRQQDRGQWGR